MPTHLPFGSWPSSISAHDVAAGTKEAITAFDWTGLILISFVFPAILALIFNYGLRKMGWVKDGDMKLS